jgi:hypothetical protein
MGSHEHHRSWLVSLGPPEIPFINYYIMTDISKLNEETEFILDRFRDGGTTLQLRQLVKTFIDHNMVQTQLLL